MILTGFKGSAVINKAGTRGVITDVDAENMRLTIAFDGAEPKKYSFLSSVGQDLIRFENNEEQEAARMLAKQEQELRQHEEETRRQRQIAEIKAASDENEAKKSRATGVSRENIIIKATYCDGGKTKDRIGYNGICSDKTIENNIKEGRRWCSDPECICCQYHSGNITRKELDDYFNSGYGPCSESCMFKYWEANAGNKLTKQNRGKGNKITGMKKGGLCILTTRLPGAKEEDRIIIGLFLVDDVYTGDDALDPGFGSVYADEKYRLEFTPNECGNMKLWKYYRNTKRQSEAHWGTGLFRYCDDVTAVKILKDAVSIKEATRDEILAKEFLDEYCDRNDLDPSKAGDPDGALTVA